MCIAQCSSGFLPDLCVYTYLFTACFHLLTFRQEKSNHLICAEDWLQRLSGWQGDRQWSTMIIALGLITEFNDDSMTYWSFERLLYHCSSRWNAGLVRPKAIDGNRSPLAGALWLMCRFDWGLRTWSLNLGAHGGINEDSPEPCSQKTNTVDHIPPDSKSFADWSC